MVGSSLCVITEGTFGVLSMNWVCGIATAFCTNCACGTCSTGTLTSSTGILTSLSLFCSWWSLLIRLHHWNLPLRQDRNFDNLADELQPLNLHGLEHSLDRRHRSLQPCSRTAPVESPQCSAQFALWVPGSVEELECPTTLSMN